jgi:hypothetical protein
MPHLLFTVLTAVLISAAMALLDERSLRQRVHTAAYLLLCFAVTTVAGSWIMHLIHG